jgi:PAS domain S-box-containing protein
MEINNQRENSKRTILLISDNKGLHKLISRILSVQGYYLKCESDYFEALTIIPDLLPDLIFIDIDDNLIVDFELLRRSISNIPFIIIFKQNGKYSKADLEKSGASEYILKGDNFSSLLLNGVKNVFEKIFIGKKLEDSLELLKITKFSLNSAKDLIFWIDESGKIFYFNQSVCNLLNYSPDELNNMKISEICHDISIESGFEYEEESITEKCSIFEYFFLTKNGNKIPVEINVNNFVYDLKCLTLIIARDITERKKTEEMLMISRNKVSHLNVVLKSLRDINKLITKEKNQIELINKTCDILVNRNPCYLLSSILLFDENKNITGVAKKCAHNSNYAAACPSLQNGNCISCMLKTLSNPQHLYIMDTDLCPECRSTEFQTRVGSMRIKLEYNDELYGILSVSTSVDLINEKEEHDLVIEIANDISYALFNLKQQKKIIESENKYESLVESSSSIICSIDLDFNFSFINKTFDHILGYPGNNLIGTNFLGIIDSEYRQNLKEKLLDIYNTNKKIIQNTRMTNSTGKKISMEMNIVPLYHEQNRIKGFLCIIQDVSEKEYLEKQLKQSQKMEAIGRLAGGIAHDFNNILTIILGNSDLISKSFDDKTRIKNGIENIRSSAMRAASLTHQLLAFSRKEMIQPKVLEVNNIINDINKLLNRLIGEDINIEIDLEPELYKIKADKSQIDQIILNLVVNSRDAMQEGGTIKIKSYNQLIDENNITLYPESYPGKFICLSIEDNGCGMDKDIISEIFEPFFTTKETGKGTGLGLSVVYGIVKQNHGWIDLISEVNKGSIFSIFFPAIQEKNTDKDQIESLKIDLNSKNRNLLLIEDETEVRMFVTEFLEVNGYNVYPANGKKEALELFESNEGNFDLVFSDVVLGDGNGIEIIEHLKSINPGLPVLLTSGYADEKSKWSIIKEKGYHFIQKPYKINDLIFALKNATTEIIKN